MPPPSALPRHYDDLEIASDGHQPVPLERNDRPADEARLATAPLFDDDIVFSDSDVPMPEAMRLAASPSETAMSAASTRRLKNSGTSSAGPTALSW